MANIPLFCMVLLGLIHFARMDYIVCSGYVNTLNETQNLRFDLSKIKVSLYYDGILKDTTSCNPDGSYMVSIDERQKQPFTLVPEGPAKAAFDPPYRIIDPMKNITLCKTNIIFVFLGFTVTGQVRSKYSSTGPAGFPVELALSDGKLVKSVLTEAAGHYKFDHVYPGDYTIRAAQTTAFIVDQKAKEFSCKVDWTSADACSKQNLIVSGYYLKGRIEKPLAGLVLGVYSKSEAVARELKSADVQKFSKNLPSVDGFHLMDAKQFTTIGDFEIPGIPAGDYKVVPVLLQNPRHFTIEPQAVEISVRHSNATLPYAFKVTEFSIKGKVLSPKRTGIEGVRVKVDAKERAVSNSKGEYTLDKMKAGTYILEAESAYYTFEPVTAVIDSGAEALPDVVADRVQVCGKIDVGKTEMAKYSGEKRIVMIKAKGGYVEQKMQADEQGVFCTEVKMGEYTVTPIVNLDESSYGLYLTPEAYDIKVEGDPIKDMRFTQIKVNVSGKVKCFNQEECKDVTVQLVGAQGFSKSVKVDKDTFMFPSILPGKYKMSINKPDFCWKESEMNIEIKSQSVKDIEFVQVGYALQYDADKDVDVEISGKPSPIHFSAGKNFYCLSSKGVYRITPIGCYKFSEPTFTYDTASPKVIKLVPKKYLIEGALVANDSTLSNINNYVTITAKAADGAEEVVKVEDDSKVKGRFPFHFFSKGNSLVRLSVTLKPGTDTAESNILFHPKMHEVRVTDKCITGSEAVVFTVSKGLIIRGKITPPAAGIVVTAKDIHDNSVVSRTTTSSTGEYRLGPLYYDDKKYVVTAHKEGYRLIKDTTNPYNFIAEQLSYLSILVKERDGTKLPGVIFDLSHSARTYRNNTRTNDEGKAYFEQLISGEYYLKPLLKEYRFEPEQMTLKITQGDKLDVEFKAFRIAFSAYGKVQLLNQRPVHNIAVEAICLTCPVKSMETSTTDNEGRYRIRGLLPKQKYELSVRKDSDPSIFKATPQKIEVTVGEADIKDINFLTLKLVGDISVSGVVNFEEDKTDYTTTPGANVELYTFENVDKPVYKEELSVLRHFRIEGLKRKDYILKVVPTGQNVYKYNSSVVQLNLATDQDPVLTQLSEKHLNLTLYRLERKAVAKSRTQMFTLLAIIGIVAAVYYWIPKLGRREFKPIKKEKPVEKEKRHKK